MAAQSGTTTTSRYSINHFIEQTAQQDRGQGLFELENPRSLEVNLQSNYVWMKMGSMVAYRGGIKFTREGALEHGIGKFLKKTVSGEGARLTKAEGTGQLYLADAGKKIFILKLEQDAITINGNDILAFEADGKIDWDISLMKSVGGALTAGLSNVTLQGTGLIAFTTHYEPLTLKVTPEAPVFTDPNATVAWSASLKPELKLDVSMKDLMGRSSGETVQMKFAGEGFVVVQPYEEVYVYSR